MDANPTPLADIALGGLSFSQILIPALIGSLILLGVHACITCASSRKCAKIQPRNWLIVALYFCFLGLVAALGASSFGTIIQEGHMSGYALLAHVTAAGAFTFLLLAIAWLYLPWGGEGQANMGNRWWLVRWSAWAMVVSGLIAAGTMFLSMLPLLGTPGLLQVAEIHRYAGLVVVVAAIAHAYALGCTRLGLR